MYQQITINKRLTAVYLLIFLIIFIVFGWALSYYFDNFLILPLALIIAVIQALVSYYAGDKIALAVSGAKELRRADNLTLFRLVENLTIADGLPMPKIYLINDSAPNALAAGRDPGRASIAVTTGLLESLNKTELEGVLAHELSHIKNYDSRLMTLVVLLVGAIALIADFFLRWRWFGGDDENNKSNAIFFLIAIVLVIAAPLIANLIQLAISRRREFLADASAALLTRYPPGLINALKKISRSPQQLRRANRAVNHLYFVNPTELLSTHPNIAARVQALEKMLRQK
ncbi:MAG: Protease HtpX [Candidatus Berkelbacteria bacterium Licking1014_2]|uniref:Protease HtpX homolog n=1 Tax=Candidatus Berkelbacteria bacterium Licking1014_2 TaxID=2017146 RepID=A0A554LX31_9BACT|nr:MAG: Protease HtpX [Candidatus Berkelbacteria bacterium Licking1014_2]